MFDLLKEIFLYGIFLYGIFFVCFYTFISLWINGFKGNKSRLALSLYMLSSTLFFAILILKFQDYYEYYVYLESFYMGLLLVPYPLLYIYIRSLVVKNGLEKKLFYHFIPAVLVSFIATFLYFSLDYPERIEYLKQFQDNNEVFIGKAQYVYIVFQLATYVYFAQGIFYFFGIYRFYKKYKLKIEYLYSSDSDKEVRRLKKIILLILVIVVHYVISVNFIGINNITSNTVLMVVIGAISMFTIGALGVLGAKQKNIYAAEDLLTNNRHNSNSTDELKGRLLDLFDEQKIFLKKDLNIWDVCAEVYSNRTYVSHLINTEFNMNFNGFVNEHRVNEAKGLLKKKECSDLSLHAIADKSGFNSLASFNRAFSKYTQISPGKFRDG